MLLLPLLFVFENAHKPCKESTENLGSVGRQKEVQAPIVLLPQVAFGEST